MSQKSQDTQKFDLPLKKKSQSSLHNFQPLGEQEEPDNINIYTHFYPVSKLKFGYKACRSILDEYHEDSKLRRSIFYGYFQLVFIFSCYFFVCHPIKKYLEEGIFLQSSLFYWASHDLLECIILWPLMITYLHLAYLLVIMRLPKQIENVITLIIMIGCVIFHTYYYSYILHPNWLYSTRAFGAICTVVSFMKTYSYVHENQILKKDKSYQPNYNEFLYYIIVPAAIFQRSYPRNEKINYKFLTIKIIFSLLGILGIYILTTDWLIPLLNTQSQKDFVTVLLELIEICFYFNFVVFYMIFESIMQVFAELSRFSDREFYRDWWNSTSYNDYVQKYNRPLDDFSRKYIYNPLIEKYKFKKEKAEFFLATFSVLVHEFVIICTSYNFTPFIIMILFIQIPFYQLFKKLEGTDWGNIVFWFIYLLAVPCVVTMYLKFDYSYLN